MTFKPLKLITERLTFLKEFLNTQLTFFSKRVSSKSSFS